MSRLSDTLMATMNRAFTFLRTVRSQAFPSRLHLRLCLIALGIGILVRMLFLIDFPFAFGHPDTSQYTIPAARILHGQPFIPDIIRVVGTYVYFVVLSLKLFGPNSLSIIVAQSLLGIMSGILVWKLLIGLARNPILAAIGTLLFLLLPRELFYEHIVLGESLYVFIILAFCYLSFKLWRRPSWSVSL